MYTKTEAAMRKMHTTYTCLIYEKPNLIQTGVILVAIIIFDYTEHIDETIVLATASVYSGGTQCDIHDIV